jgi:hypothetical protein
MTRTTNEHDGGGLPWWQGERGGKIDSEHDNEDEHD